MPTGTVFIFDPIGDDVLILSPTRATLYNSETTRTGVAFPFDIIGDVWFPSTSVYRRSPGDAGYGGITITGSSFTGSIPAVRQVPMAYHPGAYFATTFPTHRVDTAGESDADVLPTVWPVRNTVDDISGNWLVVTDDGIGYYKVEGTIPTTYERGDSIQVVARAIVNGVPSKQIISEFELGGTQPTGQIW